MSVRHHYPLLMGLAALALVVPPLAGADPAGPTVSYPTDEHGYSGTAARCDNSQTLVEFGRTSRALVAICVSSDGQLEYRGVRLSDRAGLTMAATRAADGTVTATNDGVTYAVTPKLILVSEGDTVLYRDSWTEFREPRFSTGTPTSSAPSSTTPATSPSTTPSTSPSTKPTVSTTTVTPTPTTSASAR